MERSERDAVMLYCPDIGIFSHVFAQLASYQAIVISPAGGAFLHRIDMHLMSELGDVDAFYLAGGHIGYVQIEEEVVRQGALFDKAGDDSGKTGGYVKPLGFESAHRDRDGGQVVQVALEGGADGTGDKDVVAYVRPGIDTGNDHAHPGGCQLAKADDYAVPGRAFHGIGFNIRQHWLEALDPESMAQRNGGADRALFPVRCDHDYLVYFLQRSGQRPQAGGINAVVIGHKYHAVQFNTDTDLFPIGGLDKTVEAIDIRCLRQLECMGNKHG
jgi:hypothetical protein